MTYLEQFLSKKIDKDSFIKEMEKWANARVELNGYYINGKFCPGLVRERNLNKAKKLLEKYPEQKDYLGFSDEILSKFGFEKDLLNIYENRDSIDLMIDELLNNANAKYLEKTEGNQFAYGVFEANSEREENKFIKLREQYGDETVKKAVDITKNNGEGFSGVENHAKALQRQNAKAMATPDMKHYDFLVEIWTAIGRNIFYKDELEWLEGLFNKGFTKDQIREVTINCVRKPAPPLITSYLENKYNNTENVEKNESNPDLYTGISENKTIEKEINIDEVYQRELGKLYNYQLPVIQDMDNFLSSYSKATLLDLPVGSGKTFLTKYICMLANKKGMRFIFACQNKSLLAESLYELVGEIRDAYRLNKEVIFIPSIKDGYYNFFIKHPTLGKAKTEEIVEITENLYEKQVNDLKEGKDILAALPIVPKSERDSLKIDFFNLYEDISEKIERSTGKGSSKQEQYKFNQLIKTKNQLNKVLSVIDNVEPTLLEMVKLDEIKNKTNIQKKDYESLEKDFERIESVIRHTISLICSELFSNNVLKMLDKYKWIGDLYPGTRFDEAKAVYMTASKTERNISLFGSEGKKNIFDLFAKDNVVFIDEADLYCDILLKSRIEDAIKYNINLLYFLRNSLNFLEKICDKDGKLLLEPDMVFYANKEFKPKLKTIDFYNAAMEKLTAFAKKYNIDAGTSMLYENIDNISGIPCLNVDTYGCQIIDKVYDKKFLVLKESKDINRIDIIPEDKDSDKNIRDFAQEARRCIDSILALIRHCAEVCMDNQSYRRAENRFEKDENKDSRDVVTTLTRDEIYSSVINRFGYADNEFDFVKNNLLKRKSETVRYRGEYAMGYDIVVLNDNPSHFYETYLNSYELTQLPEYNIANMVLNQKYTIFSSGTARFKSLNNIDYEYVDLYVKDKQISQFETETKRSEERRSKEKIEECSKYVEAPVFYELSSIKEAEHITNQIQKEKLKNVKTTFEIYYREIDESIYKRMEAQRVHINSLLNATNFIPPIDKEKDNYEENVSYLDSLCFAIDSMDKMLKNKAHVGLLFSGRLPSINMADNPYYTIPKLVEALSLFKKIYPDAEVIEIKRADTGSIKEITRHLETVGVGKNDYYLLLSAYKSLGAGFNARYIKKEDELIRLKDENRKYYDFDAGFFDKVTNVILGGNKSYDFNDRIKAMLETEYTLIKYSNIVEQMSIHEKDFIRRYISQYLKSIWNGFNFKKNLTVEDPNSPYNQSVAAIFLQAFARNDRGKNKSDSLLFGITDSLLNDISCNIYSENNVPTTYLFKQFIGAVASTGESVFKVADELQANYITKNDEYNKLIGKILFEINNAKTKNENVSEQIINYYNKIREDAVSFGYSDEPNKSIIGYYKYPGAEQYKTYMPIKETDNETFCNTIIIEKDNYYQSVNSLAKTLVKDFDCYQKNGYFGAGWESLFTEFLNHKDEIYNDGFKYPPYSETVFICQGEFYERIFLALSLPGGLLDTGYKVINVPASQFEDFDFMYEGTNVGIDVKGYHRSRSTGDKDKYSKKFERFNDKAAIVVINLGVSKLSVDPIEVFRPITDRGDYLYRINGIGSEVEFGYLPNGDADFGIRERVKKKIEIIKDLCDKCS